VPNVFDTEYVFPTGVNNGQISASIDHISGQQVNYTYDSLKRLSTAGTAAAGWGQAYTYDGFGNTTAATVTQGSGVNFAQSYDPSTNHAVANPQFAYDANGNEVWPSASYDGENRMTSPDGYNTYVYDPSGKRVWASATGTQYFYDIFGKQIWTSVINTPSVYFGNRLLVSQNAGVVTDRLGSVRYGLSQPTSYLPYGVEQTSTPNGQVKFGTYLRDGNSSTLGADYADQRYYNPWFGRFNTPDPGGVKTANAADPGSWNRYAYTRGDPINRLDPRGTDDCEADFCVTGTGYIDPVIYGNGGNGGVCEALELPTDAACAQYTAQVALATQTVQYQLLSNMLFPVASAALDAYAQKFADRLRNESFSDSCAKDIENLQITPEQWADALDSVYIINGVGDNEDYYPALPVGSIERQTAQDRGLTISQQFGVDSGNVAIASVNSNQVWINPTLVNPGDVLAGSSLIAHETLHNLGLTDPTIQTRLGIPVTSLTVNISDKLGQDCFK
jgi:RHS repeat-associated protein